MSLPADHPRLKKRPFTLAELVADGIVHAVALLAGLVAFTLLLAQAVASATPGLTAALAVYALGYFAMFGFSLAYNMAPPSALKWLLRRFDHSAIYVMIAGTYTAIVAHFDDTAWAIGLASVIWAIAVIGAAIKIGLPGRYDRLSIAIYIGMGWLGLLAIGPARAALPTASLWLILLGGMVYAGGVAFYKWHRLPFHNAIWHGCVALAAGLHFTAVALMMHVG